MIDLVRQVEDLLQEYPHLEVNAVEASTIRIGGQIQLDAYYEGVYLVHDYEIEALVSEDFPFVLPQIIVSSNQIPPGYRHVFQNGYLCMGTQGDLAMRMAGKTLTNFFNEIVQCNLFSLRYFEKYGEMPMGERSHGLLGFIEAYHEYFDVGESESLLGLLEAVYYGTYRGHQLCPCGSGVIGRQCHGPQIISMINNTSFPIVKDEIEFILEACRTLREKQAKQEKLNHLLNLKKGI